MIKYFSVSAWWLCAFWDMKLFQDDVFGVWLRTDFLPIWTNEAFQFFSFTLGGLHIMLPKKMLPNATIQLWNFWQNNFFLRSSLQSIIASSSEFIFVVFWVSVMFSELTSVPVNTESFLNCPSVVFSMISYRWSTKILFCLIWCFELLAGDIFG